ncbi:platelet glycoprotein Ib alpha chain-like isoform X1 [Astyanax mexicanus]|uniref:Lumican n=1 Tax=Astyanax mexicanus TaxID=7994 RepID=A0A8B9HDM3_ASTMX|nr:platelet glycoprotein Ib alpha chain-like isoform X1 [Astyanax mexicanus]
MIPFLSLFLLAHCCWVVMSSGCQSDRNTDDRPRVSCVGQGLTAVPDGIDDKTEVLVLSQNQFSSLSWTAYSRYTHLHELDLGQNHIKVIDPSGPELQNLRVLRLSNNKLEGLGGRVFRFAPALMEVYLDGNAIRTLHDASFSDLPLLEVINLSGNKLPALPHRLLESISSTSLKTFDLEDNRIKHMPDGFFSSKPELPYVYLSQNPWLCSCQVGYLRQYLDDQGLNVYKHTGPAKGTEVTVAAELPGDRVIKASIENDPESVVCAGPLSLLGFPIVELQEDQYCSTNTPSLLEHDTLLHTSPSQPITTAEPVKIIPTTMKATTTTPQTALVSTLPTSGHVVQAFTMPSMWTRLETQTVRHFLYEVWTRWISQSRKMKDNKTARTELNHMRTSKMFSTATHNSGTLLIPVTWTSKPADRPQSTSTSHQSTLITTSPLTSILDTRTSLTSTSLQVTTPQPISSTTYQKTSRTSSSSAPAPKTFNPFNHASGASQSMSGCMVPWCWWLFAGFLPLCVLSALCSCMLFLWILVTYITLYRPIQRQIHKQEDVTLLTFQTSPEGTGGLGTENGVMFLPQEKIPIESQAVFRSVLFIVKEDEGAEGDTKREVKKDKDGKSFAVSKVELVPAVEEKRMEVTMRDERQSTDRKDVFRKTLYRVISREEEIEGWREVEESWGEAESGMEGRVVERGKKRYSLILREEGGEVEDRDEGMEWLVGEWEMGGGGGMKRGSWGSFIRRIESGASLTPPTPVAAVAQAVTPETNIGGAISIRVGATQNGSRDVPEKAGTLSKRGGDIAKKGGAIHSTNKAILDGGGATGGFVLEI